MCLTEQKKSYELHFLATSSELFFLHFLNPFATLARDLTFTGKMQVSPMPPLSLLPQLIDRTKQDTLVTVSRISQEGAVMSGVCTH